MREAVKGGDMSVTFSQHVAQSLQTLVERARGAQGGQQARAQAAGARHAFYRLLRCCQGRLRIPARFLMHIRTIVYRLRILCPANFY